MKRSAFLLALLIAAPAAAGSLELEGELQQGGIIFGTTDLGAKVTLDGRKVRVSPAGRFVFGFGRDAGSDATLKVAYPDGESETRKLAIAKRSYRIQRIDGLPSKMVSPGAKALKRIKLENAEVGKARAVDRDEAMFESGFIWPAEGRISGVYGSQRVLNGEPRRPHFGIDIAAPEGTPIKAPADGVITLAAHDMYFTGGTVIMDHGHGLSSTLMHMKSVDVELGQRIKQGDIIGTVGATGRATGPHLDWRMNWFKARVDPAVLVPPMPVKGGGGGGG